MTPRVLKNVSYLAVSDEIEDAERLTRLFIACAAYTGFRVVPASMSYGTSGVIGFGVDEDIPFDKFKDMLDRAKSKVNADFHIALVADVDRTGRTLTRDHPIVEGIKKDALLTTCRK